MNTTPLDQFSITIQANTGANAPGFAKLTAPGSTLLISAASAPFQMQFDAGGVFAADAGFVFSGGSFASIQFYNATANPITVVFYVGQIGVTYIGNQNTKVGKSYLKGNLGINSAATLVALVGSYVSAATLGHGLSLGTGYVVGDLLTVAGGTGTSATLQVKSVQYNGGITSVQLVNAGLYTVNPGATNTPTGGSGSGCQLALTFQAAISGLTYTSPNLIVATSSAVPVNNYDGANVRKMIAFTVSSSSSGSLAVSDLNSCVGIVVPAGQTVAFETSAQFLLSGSGGSATVNIFEVYYSS